MLPLLKNLKLITSSKQHNYFYLIQLFITITAIFEVISIFSILPFITYIMGTNTIESEKYFKIYEFFLGDISTYNIVYVSGIVAIIIFIISSILAVVTNTVTIYFSNKIAATISNDLYKKYLNKEWLFYLMNPGSKLISRIANDASKINRIIIGLFTINSNLIKSFFIIAGIFIYSWKIASVLTIIFTSTYIFLYIFLKSKLYTDGEKLSDDQKNLQKRMIESFGVIKEIIISNNQNVFLSYFAKDRNKISNRESFILSASFIPRFMIETLGISFTLMLIIYYYTIHGGINEAIITLSIFAFASLKLSPNFQQIFFSLAEIKGYSASFFRVKDDLLNNSYEKEFKNNDTKEIDIKNYSIINLKNIEFSYPNSEKQSLEIENLDIPLKSRIGIAGASGSGKTTLINILTGLIKPQKGQIKIDSENISLGANINFQNKIGIVPQNVFLFEDTLLKNISINNNKNTSREKIFEILKICDLYNFVMSLDKNIESQIGEKGINFSGGQQQKLGIARCLYSNKDILVFDEATNSIDSVSERKIINNIINYDKDKTIILISHNYSIFKEFDLIIYFEEGKLIDVGKYDYLINKNQNFRKLANLKTKDEIS